MRYNQIIGMEITLQVGCPNNCTYCPQGVLLSKYKGEKSFTLESFQKCLETVPITRNLTFMGSSEPFLNPFAKEIILWAYNRGHKMSISTTLSHATHEDIDAIAHIPFTDTVVHVPANDGKMYINVDDEYCSRFEHAIAAWRNHPDFVISVFGIAHPKILPIWKKSGIPIVNFGLHDRAGLISWVKHNKHVGKLPLCGKQFCGHLFPNGDVARCCNDYTLSCIWGNLNEQSYSEIYKSEKFKKYIKSLEDPNSEVPCRYCNDGYKSLNPEDKHRTYDI